MNETQDLFGIDAQLFHIVSSGDLDRMCLWFYERFRYPVAIIDSSFRHVSSAPRHQLIDDPYWDGVQTEGGIPAREMASTYRYQYVDAMLRANDVIFVDWGDVKYPNINGVLQLNRSVFGYSVIIYNDEHYDRQQALRIARLFNKCALATLQSGRNAMPKNASFIQFVFSGELMSGKLTSPEALAYWQEIADVQLTGRYAVLRCSTTQDEAYRLHADLTRMRIRHLPPERRDSETFDFLLYALGTGAKPEAGLCALQTAGQLAMSEPFNDLLRIGEYCEQARLTSEIARSRGDSRAALACYRDWQSEIMLSLVRTHIYHDENCKHKIITQLEQYDATYGTDYTSTLFAWLEHFCDVLKTAGSLGIHRNTLQYRLNKINEICGCDLSDGETQAALLLSAAVLTGH